MIVLALAGLFTVQAMNRVIQLSDAVISPDGSTVAYVATHADLANNSDIDELHVLDLRTRRDETLHLAHDSYSNLLWRGDGTLLVIADDETTGTDQIYTIAKDGSERRLTGGTTDVMDASWSPDGRAIAFVRRDAAIARSGEAAYHDLFRVNDNAYLTKTAPKPARLWVMPIDSPARCLTTGSWSVDDSFPSWTSDGHAIIYGHSISPVYGLRDRTYVERIDVATGRRTALAGRGWFQRYPLVAPGGTAIAFSYPHAGDPASAPEVEIAENGRIAPFAPAFDRHVESFAWFDAHRVLARAYNGTRSQLVVLSQARPPRALPLGTVADAEISDQPVSRAGDVVFTGATPSNPSELYYLPSGGGHSERLTNVNASTEALALGRETEFRYRSGGFDQYAVVTYPPHYDPHRKYPLAIRIHGGPNLSSLVAFEPWAQLFAARGFIVLQPNYRGSSNDGTGFERAIFDDASVGPGEDVAAAIRSLVAGGHIDSARIGVSGWSYGGQLTTWMIEHYRAFKAAVVGAAVNDLVVDYAIADDIDDDRHAFSQGPWTGGLARWQAQSPISYVQRIHTPTLILSNVYDVRVPIVENYELYHALEDRGVPVEFYAWPASGHLPNGPVRLADAYTLWLKWFARYLRP